MCESWSKKETISQWAVKGPDCELFPTVNGKYVNAAMTKSKQQQQRQQLPTG